MDETTTSPIMATTVDCNDPVTPKEQQEAAGDFQTVPVAATAAAANHRNITTDNSSSSPLSTNHPLKDRYLDRFPITEVELNELWIFFQKYDHHRHGSNEKGETNKDKTNTESNHNDTAKTTAATSTSDNVEATAQSLFPPGISSIVQAMLEWSIRIAQELPLLGFENESSERKRFAYGLEAAVSLLGRRGGGESYFHRLLYYYHDPDPDDNDDPATAKTPLVLLQPLFDLMQFLQEPSAVYHPSDSPSITTNTTTTNGGGGTTTTIVEPPLNWMASLQLMDQRQKQEEETQRLQFRQLQMQQRNGKNGRISSTTTKSSTATTNQKKNNHTISWSSWKKWMTECAPWIHTVISTTFHHIWFDPRYLRHRRNNNNNNNNPHDDIPPALSFPFRSTAGPPWTLPRCSIPTEWEMAFLHPTNCTVTSASNNVPTTHQAAKDNSTTTIQSTSNEPESEPEKEDSSQQLKRKDPSIEATKLQHLAPLMAMLGPSCSHWYALYSSYEHGLAFATLQQALLGYVGPTLVIFQAKSTNDMNKNNPRPSSSSNNSSVVLGYYTQAPWKANVGWHGSYLDPTFHEEITFQQRQQQEQQQSNEAFLFTLQPVWQMFPRTFATESSSSSSTTTITAGLQLLQSSSGVGGCSGRRNYSNTNLTGLAVGGGGGGGASMIPSPRLHISETLEQCSAMSTTTSLQNDSTFAAGSLFQQPPKVTTTTPDNNNDDQNQDKKIREEEPPLEDIFGYSYFDIEWIDVYAVVEESSSSSSSTTTAATAAADQLFAKRRAAGQSLLDVRETQRQQWAHVDKTQFVDDIAEYSTRGTNSLFHHREQTRGRADAFVAADVNENVDENANGNETENDDQQPPPSATQVSPRQYYYVQGKQPSHFRGGVSSSATISTVLPPTTVDNNNTTLPATTTTTTTNSSTSLSSTSS